MSPEYEKYKPVNVRMTSATSLRSSSRCDAWTALSGNALAVLDDEDGVDVAVAARSGSAGASAASTGAASFGSPAAGADDLSSALADVPSAWAKSATAGAAAGETLDRDSARCQNGRFCCCCSAGGEASTGAASTSSAVSSRSLSSVDSLGGAASSPWSPGPASEPPARRVNALSADATEALRLRRDACLATCLATTARAASSELSGMARRERVVRIEVC